jgi:phosphopantothenoylcysteine decarboxylase
MSDKKVNILLGCTGSVATIKIPIIVGKLRQKFGESAEVRLILTKNSKFFLSEDLAEVGI